RGHAVPEPGVEPMESQSLQALLDEYAELEQQLGDPSVHADQAQARRLGRRHAELAPVVTAVGELESAREDLATARELAGQDETFSAEVDRLAERIPELESRLNDLLMPRDPYDDSDIVLEIKSGAGGEESALFAADLLRMYLRYIDWKGWRAEVLDHTESELGGYKDVMVSVKAKNSGADPIWANLKFEGGVHRVQRVPSTESQGRVHTS